MILKYESTQITLRSPDYGDTESLELGVTSATLKSGVPITHRVTTWPREETLSCVSHLVSDTELNELNTFLFNTKGLEIELFYLDEWWDGFVVSEAQTFTESNNNYYNVSFEFQGERR